MEANIGNRSRHGWAKSGVRRTLLRIGGAALGFMLVGAAAAQSADLVVTQTLTQPIMQQAARVGEPIAFEVVVGNRGPDTANGAVLSMPMAAGFAAERLDCVSDDANQRCPQALMLTALQSDGLTVPALAPGQTMRLILRGVADGNASTITQAAEVKPPPGVADSDTGNNRTEVQVIVGKTAPARHPRASSYAGTAEGRPLATGTNTGGRNTGDFPVLAETDLAVEKTGPEVAEENSSLDFTIVVRNSGPSDADGATLFDARVDNFTASEVRCGNASGGAVCPSAPTVFDLQNSGVIIPTLPSGGSVTFTLIGRVGGSAAGINNLASIRPPDGLDESDETNNEDAASVRIPVIHLTKIATSLLPVSGVPGQFVARFTVVVINQGNAPTTYGELIDTPEFPPQFRIARTEWGRHAGDGVIIDGDRVEGPGPYELSPAGTAIAAGGSFTYDLRVYFSNTDPTQPVAPCSLINSVSLPTGQEADVGDNSGCFDPPAPPTVSIADAATVTEGGTLNYAVTLSSPSTTNTVVNISLGGTATEGSDYTPPAPLSVTIPAGATSAPLPIATLVDTLFEGDETVTVTLQAGTGYSIGTPAVGTGTITDAQNAPVASIGNAAAVIEGGTLSYAVTLSGASAIDTVIPLALAGTATTGSDYLAPDPLSVTIPAGATSASIPVVTLTDAQFEGDETVTVTLQAGSGYSVGAPATGSGTITDAQTQPVASIANAATVTEGGTLNYAVTLDVASTVATVVNVNLGGTATAGSDYTPPSPLSVTVAAGSTTASLSIVTLADALFEGDETVTVTLQAGTGYSVGTPATGSGTITDAQAEPVVSIADAATVTEGGTLSYAVTLDVASTAATVVNISLGGTASAGSDYTPPNPLSVTIPAGATIVALPIVTLADALFEGDETVTVTLQAGTGYSVGTPATGSGTITDAQGEPMATIADAATVTEGGTLNYAVTVSAASTVDITIPFTLAGTATAGTDYTAPNPLSVVIPAGATTALIPVVTLIDTSFEGDETVTVTLQGGTGYSVGTPGTGSGTIADAQGEPLATIADAATVTEGGTLSYAVTLSGVSTANTVINLSLGGTATAGSDYTPPNPLSVTVPAGATTAALSIVTLADALFEGDETVAVTLQSGTGYSVGTPATGNGIIADAQQPVAAADDAGNTGSAGGTAIASVLVNDTLGGAPAAMPQVTLQQTFSSSPNVVLDTATGEVRVAAATPAHVYTLNYRLCETSSPGNCDSAIVTVTVAAAALAASNDIQGELVIGSRAVLAPFNIFANDTLDGQAIDIARIELTAVGVGPVQIRPDGSVLIQAETPEGAYEAAYEICERVNPQNCDQAVVIVTVLAATIDAADDSANVPQNDSVLIPVTVNDRLDGQPADAAASVSILTAPTQGTATVGGDRRVLYTPAAHFSGIDSFRYELCEIINPDNCTAAAVTVTVAANQVIANDDHAETDAQTAVAIAVLTNDTTLSAPLDPTSIRVETQPERGEVACTGSACTYSPSPGRAAAGSDIFIYSICDVSIPAPVCDTAIVAVDIAAGDAVLRVSKQATPRQAKPGDLVRYTLTIQNVGEVAVADATLVDLPPAGFSYVDGSLNVDDGDNAGRADGVAPLRIGGIDVEVGVSATVSYFLRVGAGVGPGTHRNTVIATDGDGTPISNEGSAEVEIVGDPLFEDSLIIGTVFDDRDGDGWQDPPDERGVPGVRLVSVEGLVIETDAYGRFHVAGVPGGNPTRGYNFILKVDRATLPTGTEFTTENPRVKRITPGLPARFDFGIRLPAEESTP